jgi:hypothetical protein
MRWRVLARAAASILLVISVACGDSTEPTAPSGRLTISPTPDFLTVGTTVALQAFAGASATGQPVLAEWSTDDGRIATVDRQGRLTGLANGTTTVRATFQGEAGAFQVRVAPNFAGDWAGRQRVSGCSHPTDATFCARTYPSGSQWNTRVTLIQARDLVTGTLFSPSVPGTTVTPTAHALLSGQIDPSGLLTMVGGSPTPSTSPLTITDWRVQLDPPQATLQGSYNELHASGLRVSWELIGLTK